MPDVKSIQEAAKRRRQRLAEAGLDPDEVERAELAAAIADLRRSLPDANGLSQLAEDLGRLAGLDDLKRGIATGTAVEAVGEQMARAVGPLN